MNEPGMIAARWETAWQAAFQKWIEGQRGGGTRRDYRRIAEQFFSFCERGPEAVSVEDVLRWRAHLEEEEYAASTIRTYLSTVKSFYLEAIDLKLVKANPVATEALPKASRYASGRYLSEAEETALLRAIDVETVWGKRDYALILCLQRSGRRTSEILGLRWGDFEMKKAGVLCKWGKLDWEVWAAICNYLEGCGRLEGMQDEDVIFTPLTDVAGRMEELYGEDWHEHALAAGSVGRLIQMYARWAELPSEEITPKALRYTAGVRKWKAGCTLEELQKFMGHSDVDVTKSWLKILQTESAKGSTSYHSQRRRRGGAIGNLNADMVTRYVAEMLATDGLSGPIPARAGVQMELWMLRVAIYKLAEQAMDVKDFDRAIKILQVMGPACMRVMKLLETERSLSRFDRTEEDWRVNKRLRELMREESEPYNAVRRLIIETTPRNRK